MFCKEVANVVKVRRKRREKGKGKEKRKEEPLNVSGSKHLKKDFFFFCE